MTGRTRIGVPSSTFDQRRFLGWVSFLRRGLLLDRTAFGLLLDIGGLRKIPSAWPGEEGWSLSRAPKAFRKASPNWPPNLGRLSFGARLSRGCPHRGQGFDTLLRSPQIEQFS